MVHNSHQVNRDFNLNFSIDEVKRSIEVVSENSKKSFTIKTKNDVFNSYSMSMVAGITVIFPEIQLKKISDTETNLLVNFSVNHKPIIANEILDKFFILVGKSLSGETIDEEIVAKGKSGCFTVIIGFIGLSTSIIYYFLS